MSPVSEESVIVMPCPDPECKEGYIVVYEAYSSTPLVGHEEICGTCTGDGYIVVKNDLALAN